MLEIEKLDLRTRHRYLRRGALAQKELDAYLASLPDSADNAEWVDYDRLFEEEAEEELSTPPPSVEAQRPSPSRVEPPASIPPIARAEPPAGRPEPSSFPRGEASSLDLRHDEPRKTAALLPGENAVKPSTRPAPTPPAPAFSPSSSFGYGTKAPPEEPEPTSPRAEAGRGDARVPPADPKPAEDESPSADPVPDSESD